MDRPLEEMSKDELLAECARLGEALAGERHGREADTAAATVASDSLKRDHQHELHERDAELRVLRNRAREIQRERDSERTGREAADQQNAELGRRLAGLEQAHAAMRQKLGSAQGWNAGLGLTTLIATLWPRKRS
jgi:chromosome segregation ATPase